MNDFDQLGKISIIERAILEYCIGEIAMFNGLRLDINNELVPIPNDKKYSTKLKENNFYYKNGKQKCFFMTYRGTLHNDDKPAIIVWDEIGNKRLIVYYFHGEIHRIDKPAAYRYFENESLHSELYFDKGRLHKTDGPASRYWYPNGDILKELYVYRGNTPNKVVLAQIKGLETQNNREKGFSDLLDK